MYDVVECFRRAHRHARLMTLRTPAGTVVGRVPQHLCEREREREFCFFTLSSSVAPAPCFARARPCLDVWWGEPSLVQLPAPALLALAPSVPMEGAAHRRLRYGVLSHLWLWGVEGLGTGPCGGPSLLGYPGSLGGLPASRLSTCLSSPLIVCTPLPTTIVCSSATLPLPLPLSTFYPPSPCSPPSADDCRCCTSASRGSLCAEAFTAIEADLEAFSPGRAAAHDGHGRLAEGERAF